jgi:hypothetical protein
MKFISRYTWNSAQQNKEMKRIIRPHANRVMKESYGEVQGLTEQVQQLTD